MQNHLLLQEHELPSHSPRPMLGDVGESGRTYSQGNSTTSHGLGVLKGANDECR